MRHLPAADVGGGRGGVYIRRGEMTHVGHSFFRMLGGGRSCSADSPSFVTILRVDTSGGRTPAVENIRFSLVPYESRLKPSGGLYCNLFLLKK